MNAVVAALEAAFAAPVRPWFAPYVPAAAAVCAEARHGAALPDALNAAAARLQRDVPKFVPQAALPGGEAYESFIFRTGQVPTRELMHDLWNGLVWLRFPTLKRRLNTLHAQAISREGIGPRRGPVRDALTLFDENAAWLQGGDALVEALRRHDWPAVFGTQRAAWAEAQTVCFGHALLEKLMQPHTAITAHVWALPPGAEAEAWLADAHEDRITGARRLALPVLGVPGWWPANEVPGFYGDTRVFRPSRAERERERAGRAAP